nr:acetyltransferase [Chondromyces crocatus]
MTSVSVEEFDRLVEVWEAAVRATHHFLSEEDIAHFRPLVRNEFLQAVSLFAVRDARGVVTGFAGVANGKLEMLFVHPAHHGAGIGRCLVEHAIEAHEVVEVDVNEQNPQAVGFYERLGFSTYRRSPTDGMGKPFPILHMRLRAPRRQDDEERRGHEA